MSSSGSLSLMSLPMFQAALPVMAAVDPLRVKAIVQSLRRLELIHDERVIMMMPFDVVVR